MSDAVVWSELQVQEYRNINANSLRASRVSGELWGRTAPGFIKVGRKVFYKPETIDAWLKELEETQIDK